MDKSLNGREVAKQLAKVKAESERQIVILADRYRTEVLIPLCRKKKLTFWSGNGDFWFEPQDPKNNIGTFLNRVVDAGDARDAGLNILVKVLQVLDQPDGLGFVFGNHVSSVFTVDCTSSPTSEEKEPS